MKSLQEYDWLVIIVELLIQGKYYWSATAYGCDVKLECRTLSSKQSAVSKWKRFAKKNKISSFTIVEDIE